jgi:hypothetical protein
MDFYRQRLKQDLVNYECFKDILDVDMDKENIIFPSKKLD